MDLHDYQIRGLEWMISAVSRGHGVILGDEMGLGKTIQTIALLAYINNNCKDASSHRHVIVCPLSELTHWGSELKRFALSFLYKITIDLPSFLYLF